MQYPQLRYLPESQDPSVTIETQRLVVKVIDNTGLSLPRNAECKTYFGAYGVGSIVPFSHHLGYHGIRTFYDKAERRNAVIPFASWLNLQTVELAGLANDPVDERAWAGVGRGWPMRIEPRGRGALLTLDPMPQTAFGYTLELQPAEPDAIDFSVRFVFYKHPASGASKARFTWPCYMNGYDDVAFHYPRRSDSGGLVWASIGERPEMVVGETVGYAHQQEGTFAQEQALPVGYGRIGSRALTIMFDDPGVRLFIVDTGGHMSCSAVQNPAWDFEWSIADYPLGKPVGFNGRLIYGDFESAEAVLRRYRQWRG
jgi:hypothetical protein